MQSVETIETEILVSDVQLGMQITRLDRPWSETDFPLQGFIVRSPDDIQAIREQCETVFILGQVSYVHPRDRAVSVSKASTAGAKTQPTKTQLVRRINYINQIPFDEELSSAMESFHRCRNLATRILDSVRLGRVIELNEIRPVVKGVVASILRNHSALLWLTQIRSKDGYTAEHCMNVCVLAAAFGKHLGLMESEIETLALAGLLHDVGKVKVDQDVLNKPGAFTEAEFAHMKLHPVYGRQLLLSVHGLPPVAVDVAHAHHERMDGSGYPRGLLHNQIPYFAKVVSVVDAYDAMTGERVYDKAKSSKQALDIIYKCRGKQFDDDLALEFIRFCGIYPPGSLVELSSGEIALVLESYPQNRLRPRVLVVRSQEKAPCTERVVDLLKLNVSNSDPITVTREWPNGSYDVDLRSYLEKGLILKTHSGSQDPDTLNDYLGQP
ncbi:MAG: HD-GYP domain-containing protein [Marinobacter sp.]|uniref:HD-GYP domain-containing protein n=1 Tax=Marinobacter sp. TaxID=50741 RepID=UPI00299F490B|nr:HD-GYP domain-containing protein [Marinobacter sp.]MDX1634634.1 HD-GYP domain-containing protein [Marinobacter sp.]